MNSAAINLHIRNNFCANIESNAGSNCHDSPCYDSFQARERNEEAHRKELQSSLWSVERMKSSLLTVALNEMKLCIIMMILVLSHATLPAPFHSLSFCYVRFGSFSISLSLLHFLSLAQSSGNAFNTQLMLLNVINLYRENV